MKNTLESTGNRADPTEERNSELKDRNLEVTQAEEKREINTKNEEIPQQVDEKVLNFTNPQGNGN